MKNYFPQAKEIGYFSDIRLKYLVKQYYNMKSRVTGKDPKSKYYLGLPICSYTTFLNWAYDDKDFNKFFLIYWKKGKQQRFSPSIDRIDNKKGYTLDNMRFLPKYLNVKGK